MDETQYTSGNKKKNAGPLEMGRELFIYIQENPLGEKIREPASQWSLVGNLAWRLDLEEGAGAATEIIGQMDGRGEKLLSAEF